MTRPPEVPLDRSPPMPTDRIRIENGERRVDAEVEREAAANVEVEVEVVNDTPPDPRAVIEDLRGRLREEQEKTLNSVDAVVGARAAAAQAKAETQDVFYRLHVRETELAQLKELLAEMGGRADDGMDSSPSPTVAAKTLLASVKRAVSDR